VSHARSEADAGEWNLAAVRDRQGLFPGAIVPTNIQYCCTHNLHGHQDATGSELLNDTFAMFGNERATRPLLNPLPHGFNLKERESGDAKTR
jgi:hypothetical protein